MAEIAIRVAIEVVQKTSSILIDLVAKEGFRLTSLQEEIHWLERELRHIQSYLIDIEQKQGESQRVANLMSDIRDLAFDIEDTTEKYFPSPQKTKGFKRFACIFTNGYNARSFLVEIEAIKRRVEDINRVRQTYGISEHVSTVVERDTWDARRSFPHADEPNITGFERHIKNLTSQLESKDLSLLVVSIIGMAGLGKTTLAKKVYNNVLPSFDLAAWVYVSEQPVLKNIMIDMAKQVGSKREEYEDNVEANLFKHLNQHRFVIAIDDIWDTKTWDILKNAIPRECQNRSRIILTSRNRDVGVHLGGWSSLFHLKPLGERYSKQLFETALGHPRIENDSIQLKKIGDGILHRCGGVPLAIVIVSGLLKLKERTDNAWKGVLEQMDHVQGELSKTFSLSYLDLPSNLKPCFLYLGTFPEDHEIGTFDLINLWVSEGFINESGTREVEDVGEDYINHLIVRNLIQVVKRRSNGKVKSCRVHDILHSLCIRVAKELNFFTTSKDSILYNCERIRRLTTHGIGLRSNIPSSNYRTPTLRSFLCFDDGIDLNLDFPKDIKFLRVLYLNSTVSIDYSSKVIKEIWSFKNLTHLKLGNDSSHRNVDISISIIRLENLLTLDLGSCTTSSFPMVIWNMKRLRHLLMPVFMTKRKKYNYHGFNPKAISFQNFQTLALQGDDVFHEDWFQKLVNLRKLIIGNPNEVILRLLLASTLILNKLEYLGLHASSRIRLRVLDLSGYQSLNTLILRNIEINHWPQTGELLQNLTKIMFHSCGLREDPLEVMKKMPKLRVLKLQDGAYGSGDLVCKGENGNFSQLQHLEILTSFVYKITIEDGGMLKLKKLLVNWSTRSHVPSRIEVTVTPGNYPQSKASTT